MKIASLLVSIWDKISRVWVFFRNLFARNHTLFLGFGWWLGIRLAVKVWAFILTHIYTAINSVRSAAETASQMGATFSAVSILDFANAVFPLQEALILGASLLSVKVAFMALNAIRYVYKNIPLKAS